MAGLVFNALLSSFFVVRVTKGRWKNYPHYLAVALVASVAALLILGQWSPGAENSFVYGNIVSLAGGWLGILAYDQIAGAA